MLSKLWINKEQMARWLLLALLLMSFGTDLIRTQSLGMPDLRNRVVGVRAALENKNPYQQNIDWDDSRTIDPLAISYPVFSRLTVTPPMVFLHIPFALMNYYHIRIIWLSIQWIALVILVFLLINAGNQFKYKSCLFVSIILIFIHTPVWRSHIDAGQIYIIYPLLFSLAVLLIKSRPLGSVLILSLLSLLRPHYLVVQLLVLIQQRSWYQALVSLVFLILGSLLPMLAFNPAINQQFFEQVFATAQPTAESWQQLLQTRQVYRGSIEGGWYVWGHTAQGHVYDISLERLVGYFFTYPERFSLVLLLAIICLSLLWARRHPSSQRLVFVVGLLVVLVADFLLPIPYYQYALVQVLPLLALVAPDDKIAHS